MTPGTINALLNTAPMILQGANKLIKLIRDREHKAGEAQNSNPTTLEDLKQEISKIELRLNENSQSDVEQIRLIEELAKQNESLAETLQKTLHKVWILNYITILTLAIAACAIVLVFIL